MAMTLEQAVDLTGWVVAYHSVETGEPTETGEIVGTNGPLVSVRYTAGYVHDTHPANLALIRKGPL